MKKTPMKYNAAKQVRMQPISKKDQGTNFAEAFAAENMQKHIDEHNTELAEWDPEKTPIFENYDFANECIIVKLYFENFVKRSVEMEVPNEDGTTTKRMFPVFYGWSQIDGRKRTSDQETFVDTPLPYVLRGRVSAISEFSKNKLAAQGIDIEVGSTVLISETILKDRRFYINKQVQKLDWIFSQTEYTLSNHDGHFKFMSMDIEAVEKTKQNETKKENN